MGSVPMNCEYSTGMVEATENTRDPTRVVGDVHPRPPTESTATQDGRPFTAMVLMTSSESVHSTSHPVVVDDVCASAVGAHHHLCRTPDSRVRPCR